MNIVFHLMIHCVVLVFVVARFFKKTKNDIVYHL